jgi:hypothetical protein
MGVVKAVWSGNLSLASPHPGLPTAPRVKRGLLMGEVNRGGWSSGPKSSGESRAGGGHSVRPVEIARGRYPLGAVSRQHLELSSTSGAGFVWTIVHTRETVRC